MSDEKLYYLKDPYGHYRSYVILCNKPCELPPKVHSREAVIYTAQQLDVAKRYYKRNGIIVYEHLVGPSQSTIERRRKKEREQREKNMQNEQT